MTLISLYKNIFGHNSTRGVLYVSEELPSWMRSKVTHKLVMCVIIYSTGEEKRNKNKIETIMNDN